VKISKAVLLFNTVKYLKPVQIYYRLYYFARRRVRRVTGFQYPFSVVAKPRSLTLKPSISSYISLDKDTFTFLNLSHTFENGIDWNYAAFGKLWTYNLTYFDYLHQEGLTKEKGMALIHDFIGKMPGHQDALEPFPISLRGINWIKFLTYHQIRDTKIDDSLYAQYHILMDNLEYHLLGNHLLENGFSLLFGAYYFSDEKMYAKATEILEAELDEQILEDGAHFELSPMYHQIMLFRVLDCINLLQSNKRVDGRMSEREDRLKEFLEGKAAVMLRWLNAMTFEDGSIPLFNDSTNGIAPTTEQLNEYAAQLTNHQSPITNHKSQITNHQSPITNHQLQTSGYRKITKEKYEMILDIGPVGPDYIPGHAHADTFNFELHIKPSNYPPSTIDYQPFIIDTGLSTYETNARRTEERSTAAHNTVEVNETSSSEVWGGFRVAERAYVTQVEEKEGEIVATHNGYEKKFGILHTRTWRFEEERIVIRDTLNKSTKAVARLYFHPDVTKAMIYERVQIENYELKIKNYRYAPEFNKLVDALVLEIPFKKEIEVSIRT
jgi:hypothetical protein